MAFELINNNGTCRATAFTVECSINRQSVRIGPVPAARLGLHAHRRKLLVYADREAKKIALKVADPESIHGYLASESGACWQCGPDRLYRLLRIRRWRGVPEWDEAEQRLVIDYSNAEFEPDDPTQEEVQ